MVGNGIYDECNLFAVSNAFNFNYGQKGLVEKRQKRKSTNKCAHSLYAKFVGRFRISRNMMRMRLMSRCNFVTSHPRWSRSAPQM